jgi:hypothetical protein
MAMLQVMIKVSSEASGIVYSLEIYQNSRFVRLLKAKSATELLNAVTTTVSRFANSAARLEELSA